MSYLAIKHIHLTTVVLSLLLFLVRAAWVFYSPDKLKQRWVKIVPHIIDSCLLISAFTLAVMLQQYPFVEHWLTAKVLALCLYIVLGTIALKRGRTMQIKATAMVGALISFAYIAAVALTHSPTPWAV